MPDDPPDRVPPHDPPMPPRPLPPFEHAHPLQCHPLDGLPREWTVVSHLLTDTTK